MYVFRGTFQREGEGAPPVKRSRDPPQTDVGWLSESGVLDCMVLLGPTPHLAFSQYAQLTGTACPPQHTYRHTHN